MAAAHASTRLATTRSKGARDPVCGMIVDPHTAPHRHHAGRTYYFCSAGCLAKFSADPPKYHRPRTRRRPRRIGSGRDDLHLSDASPDPPGGTGLLPDLRHGARAGAGHRGDRPEPRTRRHDAPVLDRSGPDASGRRAGDGRPSHQSAHAARPADVELAPAPSRHAGRAVGRLALLRARLAVARHAQPEHVHADRDGHGRRLGLQRRCDRRCRISSRRPSAARMARSRSISRRPRSSRCSSCSARCSSCGRARARAAPSARCSTSRQRPPGSCAATAAKQEVQLDAVQRRRPPAGAPGRKGAGRRRRLSRGAARSTSRW